MEAVWIDQPEFLLGRSRSYCHFIIPENRYIARIHARILNENNCYYLVDHNTVNGTSVNGRRIPGSTKIPLRDGDYIQLADEGLWFRQS